MLSASLVWLAVFSFPSKNLKIIACDVGQGDAILTIYGSTQILIDGGPGNRVLECLGKHIPFWDRQLELVILTHPQADHYEGLTSVFREYQVNTFVANSLNSDNQGYQVLKNEVGGSQARVINPKKGMKVRLGLIYLDILWPTTEFVTENSQNSLAVQPFNSSTAVLGAYTSSVDSNEFSVQVLLSFKDFKALFTGDASLELSDTVAKLLPQFLNSSVSQSVNYLKVPHHGSKNGLSEGLLKVLNPEGLPAGRRVAIISDGKNNTYGHPHKEILDILKKYNVQVYRTDEMGNIVVETDGFDFRVRP